MTANGQYTSSQLVAAEPSLGWPKGYLQSRAARAWWAFKAWMRATYGITPMFNEGYRPLATQVFYWNLYLSGQGNPAARPGFSKHGDGWAIDLNWPFTSWTTIEQQRWRANEAAAGWSSSQGVADNEPWHKVNVGDASGLITAGGGGSTPIPNDPSEEDILNELNQSTKDFITKTVYDQVNAILNDPKTGAIPNAVATLTNRMQREARGRLFFCETPPAGLPRFVILFQQRNPGEQNVLYIWPQDGLTDEQRAANLGANYGQTADTVAQAKAVPDTPTQFRTRINIAIGNDGVYTNPTK